MSDTTEIIEERQTDEGTDVSVADLQRMLAESRTRISNLESERDTERRQRSLAERDRDAAHGQVQNEAQRRYLAEVQSADEALAAAQAEADRAEDAYVQAIDAGDSRAAAKAQRALAEATARHAQQSQRKQWLDANKESLTRVQAPPQSHDGGGDEYDRAIPGLLPSEKTWLKDRSHILTDAGYRKRVFAASNLAVAEGIDRGSQQYFRRMEEVLGEGRQESHDREEPAPRATRQPSGDLPPQRRPSPGTPPSAGRKLVELTADQAEVADGLYGNPASDSYIADPAARYKKYADNLQRMRASGRM